jgi:hypothetical protein
MTGSRLLPAVALAAGLLLSAITTAQPPGVPGQPPGGRVPPLEVLPVVPKSAGAFVTLKVSALANHADLKPVLEELAKQPDALAGISELIGVSPLEIDRVTLFWPRVSDRGGMDPILVVTTREPFNEARVLKALKADPVFDVDAFRGRGHGGHGKAGGAKPHVQSSPEIRTAPEPLPKLVVPDPLGPAPPIVPKGFEKGLPPPPPPPPGEKPNDDSCAPAADGGPSDPLFYALDRGAFEALFLIDDRTLVFLPGGSEGEFANMALLAATLKKNATGPLAEAITTAGKHTFAAGVHLTPLFREFDRRKPAELVPYTALLAARTAVFTGDLDKSAKLTLTLTFDDATAAKRAAPVLEEGIAAVAGKVTGLADELKESRRPVEKSAAPLVAAFAGALKKAKASAEGPLVTTTTEVDLGPAAAKALGDLLQAVQSRKKADVRMNNLKQIGLALHNYHDAHGKFPTNVYGPNGEPLLSWRVHLLPYMEEDNLYKQFKMDEAWDGPNNKKLIDKMPKVYLAPDRDHPKGQTFYQGFAAPDPRKAQPPKDIIAGHPWLRDGVKDGIRMASIADGTSNTLAVIEAGRGVVWSKPEDLPFGGPVPPLGEKGWDRTPALRFDGSVLLFPTDLKAEVFWHYVTINGGEVTPDLDDDRRRPGGGRPVPQPPVANPPVPNDPVKQPDGAEARLREVRELALRVEELVEQLRAEEARAAAEAELAVEATRAFQVGKATAEDVAKAKARADEARKRVQISVNKLRQGQAELETAKARAKDAKPRPEK